jgi:hypothetical protein
VVLWIHKQLQIAAVGQSPIGLWYTCVHAKQLQIYPMYMRVEKIKIKILPTPETMQCISTSAESKEERSQKTLLQYSCKINQNIFT